jgi:hypothetical protein
MVVEDGVARADVRAALEAADLTDVRDVMVGPTPANPLRSEVIVRLADGYLRGEHRPFATPRVHLDAARWTPARAGPGLAPDVVERAARAAMEAPEARDYLEWTRYPYVQVTSGDGGYRVRFADVRYDGRGGGSLAGLSVWLDAGLRTRRVEP